MPQFVENPPPAEPNGAGPQDPARDREAITFRHKRWRAVAAGVIEPLATTFFLLIAIQFYAAEQFTTNRYPTPRTLCKRSPSPASFWRKRRICVLMVR